MEPHIIQTYNGCKIIRCEHFPLLRRLSPAETPAANYDAAHAAIDNAAAKPDVLVLYGPTPPTKPDKPQPQTQALPAAHVDTTPEPESPA